MPIVIDKDIPAYSILGAEKIFVMEKNRASTQDIRPIEIALLNLMPTKVETETLHLPPASQHHPRAYPLLSVQKHRGGLSGSIL